MSEKKFNGRVDLSENKAFTPFPLFNDENRDDYSDSLKTIQESTLLNRTFFSKENVNLLQISIRKKVQESTGKIISNQSVTELEIVMRSVYLQYSEQNDDNIREQIQRLNNVVLQETVPNIISNMYQYLQYKKDITSLPEPLAHSSNLSIKGDKSLMMQPFF